MKIGLVAHDDRKGALMEWCAFNRGTLAKHELWATGTTGTLLEHEIGLKVNRLLSGPKGGDQQIGAMIATGNLDVLFFFWDPESPQPHDPDVKALLRIAVLYDIPVAMNRSTADFLLTSRHMDQEYERRVLNYNQAIEDRFTQLKEEI